MSDDVVQILKLFPAAKLGLPCSDAEIIEAENLLGQKLPPELRSLYEKFNGVDVPGSSCKLFPLLPRHSEVASLVGFTIFIRNEPWAVDVSEIVFYGLSRGGLYWGVNLGRDGEVVQYNHDMEQPKRVARSVLDAYRYDEEWFAELGN